MFFKILQLFELITFNYEFKLRNSIFQTKIYSGDISQCSYRIFFIFLMYRGKGL